jgi:hypothetical protein
MIKFIMFGGAAVLGIGLVWRLAPGKSRLYINRSEPHFPVVSGYNLDRNEFEFPRDFAGRYNLVIVAFQQYHQNTVNTWIPFVQEIEAYLPGFIYYELPTINEMPVLSRTFINEGMRAGIPDQTARERTITLYIDKMAFRSAMGIPNEKDIWLFLVDQNGDILWKTMGEYTDDKADDLASFLESFDPR